MDNHEMENQELKRIHVFVAGFVQGVFFRENTRQKAQSLGLKGWIRNLDDGRVEAVFEGPKNKIDKIADWMKKGPILARVKNFDIFQKEYKNEFTDFKIIT